MADCFYKHNYNATLPDQSESSILEHHSAHAFNMRYLHFFYSAASLLSACQKYTFYYKKWKCQIPNSRRTLHGIKILKSQGCFSVREMGSEMGGSTRQLCLFG